IFLILKQIHLEMALYLHKEGVCNICSTMLHTPLTTSLFLGLSQLDYTLNVNMLIMYQSLSTCLDK
ncbi:hypothetical protein ACJX0J_027642, partial [Zea mays]